MAYSNGTSGTFDYDPYGRLSGITWMNGTTLITSDTVTRSLTGRVLNDYLDGATAPTWAYTYDGAGRLTRATGSGHDYQYGYGTTVGCAGGTNDNPNAGLNSNRASVTDNGIVTQRACFDQADRLTSYSAGTVVTPSYDYRGNVTSQNGDTFGYDAAGRHMTTLGGGTTVTYVRDATGAVVGRTDSSTGVTTRYSGAAVLDPSNNVLERTINLVGGVLVTKRSGGDVWSYPNIHGDIAAVCDSAGVKQGPTFVYDPYGNTTTLPDNSNGGWDYGWLGQHTKGTEHATGINTNIEMGARIYNSVTGRFLSADAIEGGNNNDYLYPSDPINQYDLTGNQCVRGYTGRTWYTYTRWVSPSVYMHFHLKRVKGSVARGDWLRAPMVQVYTTESDYYSGLRGSPFGLTNPVTRTLHRETGCVEPPDRRGWWERNAGFLGNLGSVLAGCVSGGAVGTVFGSAIPGVGNGAGFVVGCLIGGTAGAVGGTSGSGGFP